jgi:hypothetical protein
VFVLLLFFSTFRSSSLIIDVLFIIYLVEGERRHERMGMGGTDERKVDFASEISVLENLF